MKRENRTSQHPLMPAVEAINNLTAQELGECFENGQHIALMAHHEIELAPVNHKSAIFFRNLVPWRRNLVSGLSNSYRRYFRLALAHARETSEYPDEWAWQAIQPALKLTLEQLLDWYILACDGENQYVRMESSSIPFVPGGTVSIPISLSPPPAPSPKSWRAPSWLFQIAPTLGFTRPLKSKHVPAIDSNNKLEKGHSRLILKLARRVLLWELGASVEKVRNEEVAAAAAVPAQAMAGAQTSRAPNKRTGWEQRLKLYSAIQKILTAKPHLKGMDFCGELDKRHAPPLHDWVKSGDWREGLTWKEAWAQPALRKKIRRVRQEAMKYRSESP